MHLVSHEYQFHGVNRLVERGKPLAWQKQPRVGVSTRLMPSTKHPPVTDSGALAAASCGWRLAAESAVRCNNEIASAGASALLATAVASEKRRRAGKASLEPSGSSGIEVVGSIESP